MHRKQDIGLFVPGATVTMVYALDELKAQPAADGSVDVARIVLEGYCALPPHRPSAQN
ncbi:MAG: hypothetical protein ACOH2S_18970 [Janthinobacterium svalbardensis]|uniref:hypothetical protein n=1 Tax=Janthinobacterium svalbardensis TaxID=368607 RepID=UPI001ABFB8C8|nr:hypothetical protein [Janthinobacterium svalbardensis]